MSDAIENQNENEIEKAMTVDLTHSPSYEDESDTEDFEYVAKYEDWDMDERLSSVDTIDWEKEAKKTVHIDLELSQERRRTIFELDAYTSSGPSRDDIIKLSTTDIAPEQRRQIRYSVSMGIPGIARIDLSPLTQKVIGCVIGENVSTEYPWVYVQKNIIEDNIDLHEESSDFLSVKDEIKKFRSAKILIGYVPSLIQDGQFYICLTEEGQDAITEIIQKQRVEHENRVRTAVYKPLGEWDELGSSAEVRATIVKNTRPLLEIELLSTVSLLNADLKLEDRRVNDQRDGYVELIPYRQTFDNVSRRLICKMTQVTPSVQECEVQTHLSIPLNRWTQYLYEYKTVDISTFNEEQRESLKNFLLRFSEEICDEVLVNATWDIYTNDYGNLVINIRDTQWLVPAGYTEHLSFHEGHYVVDKVINDFCWHPLWTGIAYIAYTRYSKSHQLVGPKSPTDIMKTEDNNYVLVWSFNDSLAPKLVLECAREVTAIAVHPIDGTLIVGGCANGQFSNNLKTNDLYPLQGVTQMFQIALWHIPGRIEQVEAVVVKTPAQMKYRTVINRLTIWLREMLGTSFIRPTAMSSLKFSQKGTITQISWIPSYDRVNENGRLETLPEDTPAENLSSQFVTTSEDGTIAFWDINLKKFLIESRRVAMRTILVNVPEGLQDTSLYKHLDRIFRPHYLLVVNDPEENRRQVVTSFNIDTPQFKKKLDDTFPFTSDITIRRCYTNVVKKPDYVMKPVILIGTVDGIFGSITWDGYEFTTDMTVNTETCRWVWYSRLHDGPVTHAIRARFNENIIATVGGKIFSIWKEDFDIPLTWKKSSIGYTACAWGSFRPTAIILARMDGSVEIWDFMVKSQEPCVIQSLSGRIITGIYMHELYLANQCIGFGDYNGIFRVFLSPIASYRREELANVPWMKKFIQRQYDRITKRREWQKSWINENRHIVESKKEMVRQIIQKRQKEKRKIRQDRQSSVREVTVQEFPKNVGPLEMIEQARERWKTRELKRMQQVILEKKGLRKDDLEKQREPILKMRQDVNRKKMKLQQTLDMQEDIFEHTVAMFFPEREQKGQRISLTPTMLFDPRATQIGDRLADTILQQEVGNIKVVDPQEEILYNFMETQAQMFDYLEKNPFVHKFNWRKILTEGKTRRISMDYNLPHNSKRKNKHSRGISVIPPMETQSNT